MNSATTGAGLSVPSIHAGLLSLPDDAAVAEVFAAAITPDVVVPSQVRRLEDVGADPDPDQESPRD